MRTYRLPLRLFLVAAAVCTIVGCGGSQESRNEIPRGVPSSATTVTHPRVAMLNATTAAVSYYQRAESSELVTYRYQLLTGDSEFVASSDADLGFPPFHLGAVGNGIGILLHSGSFGQSDRGCAIRTVGGAQCTPFAPDSRSIFTAMPAATGQAIALYGDASSLLERTYDSVFGWGSTRPGPVLSTESDADRSRSVARWRDGSAYLVATKDGAHVASRYDAQRGVWLAPETLGTARSDQRPPEIALHPAAPAAAPVAVWESAQGIAFSVWESGTGWSASALIPGAANGSAPTVAMWPSGDVLVVWHTPAVVAVRRINNVWQPPESIGTTSGTTKIALGLDDQGNAVTVWAGGGDLKSANYLAGEGWQPASTVGELAAVADDFDVAMAPEGRALAVWARPAGGQDPGSRLAIAEVGPFALTLSAQRYTFGGDTLPLTIRLASAPTQATTVSLSTNLPPGSISLPPSIPVAANQSEVTFDVPTSAVADFVDGVIVLTYGGVRVNRPVTLMPEPTAVALSVAPTTVLGGEAATISLQVTPIYPVALNLQLESNNAVAPVPAQVTTGMTSSAAAVPVTTTTTTTAQTATFTARFRNRTGTGSLLVNPTSFGQAVLTVSVAFTGSGTVTSTPAGITNCSQTCTASYPIGTPVTLTPTPTLGWRFFAWEGDPDCSEGKLTMNTARTCRAIFLGGDQPYPDGTGWTQIARPLPDLNYVNPSPALALENLIPIVAHLSKVTPTAVPQVYVQRLQGANSTYLQMGSDSLNIDKLKAASEPAIATTNNGLPFVAWIEGSGAQRNLYVSRINYGNGLEEWVSVGPLNTPLNYVAGSRASSPSIALDAELNPMVAWIEDGAVKFKRFNGTAWVQVQGGEGPVSAGADRVRLSSHSSFVGVADPVIAWTQGSGMSRALKVVRDFAFTPLGTQVNPASSKPLIEFAALAESNGGIVTWGDGGDAVLPFTIRSQRWDGTTWVNVGGQVVNNNPHRLVSLAMAWNGLGVVWNYRFLPNDTSHLGVSTFRNGFWSLITTELVLPGDANIGPTPVEFANGDSPIVVRVERNSLNEYIWWTLRYYQP